MCIIISKYFPDIGWVGLKNRDRNYIPEISFKKSNANNMEILYFWDDITQYCEGFNSNGISILSASLLVIDDEKEIEKRSKTPSKDGIKIKNALRLSNIKEVVKELVDNELSGNTIIFNETDCYILESSYDDNHVYRYKVRRVPESESIVRTNHGVWLPWAGYQRDGDISHELSRVSSESRKKIAEFVTNNSNSPDDILDGLTENYTNHGQLNALRTTHDKKKMRTTSQIMIIPSELTMFIRPVQSNIIYNFWEFNGGDSKTWVEILSNRILHHGRSKSQSNFFKKLKHDL